MSKVLYRKFFYIYYITSLIFITFIIVLLVYANYSFASSTKTQIFQSYTHNVIMYLENDTIVSDSTLVQYDANAPIFFLVTDNNRVVKSYCSEKIESSPDILQHKIKEHLSHSYMTDNDQYITPLSDINNSRIEGVSGEDFRWFYARITTAANKEYELYMAYLLNHGIFSLKQIILYIILELLFCSILFCIGKYFVKIAIIPIEQNMENQKHFVASASHELKTPISVITLANNSNQPDAQHIIEQECIRMDKIVKNLLFLASSESCTWKTDFQMIRFDMLLIEFYEISQPLLKKHKMNIEFELPDQEIENAMFDKMLIIQLLTILLDNAIAYADTSNLITIKLLKKKNSLILEFIDYGSGISDVDKPHVFNSFYKATTAPANHYGLGLSIAKTIVTLHHGTISISDTSGGGATFVIELPLRFS